VKRTDALTALDLSLSRVRRAQASRLNLRAQAERSGVALSRLSLAIVAELHRHGPARVQALAELADAELPRVSREVHLLQDLEYVRIKADDADGRARVVHLTRLGAQRWLAYRKAGRDMLDELLAGWDDADVVAFADLFDRFLRRPLPSGQEPAAQRHRPKL
jgi:DNA-binding MarR family transcriptional regulator